MQNYINSGGAQEEPTAREAEAVTASRKRPLQKKPAAVALCVVAPWNGRSPLTCVKGSKKSYLQYKDAEGKLRLLVAITTHMSRYHKNLIDQVAVFAKTSRVKTKAEVVAYRDRRLAR